MFSSTNSISINFKTNFKHVDARRKNMFIGVQIMEEFVKQNNQTLDADCRKEFENQLFMNLIVESVYRKRLTSKHEKFNRQLHDVIGGFAQNPDAVEREVLLPTFFEWNYLDSYSIYIDRLSEISGIVKFQTSRNQTISLNFSGDEKYNQRSQKTVQSLTPITKIKMKPLSSCKVHFNYYSFDSVWNYEIDFKISRRSIINIPNYLKYCVPGWWPKLPLNIVEFLESNPNFYQLNKYDNYDHPKIINENGIFILKWFLLTENLSTTELETEILNN